jgi:protein tyrosine/serine phosphatase
VPVPDYQMPPLSSADLAMIQKTFTKLPKPWLIHCSAGIDRTGAAVEFVRNHLG